MGNRRDGPTLCATSLFSLACLVSSPGELTSLFDGPTQSFNTVILTVPSAAMCYLTPQRHMRHHCHGQKACQGPLNTWSFHFPGTDDLALLQNAHGYVEFSSRLDHGSLWCLSRFILVDSLIRARTTWRQTLGYVCENVYKLIEAGRCTLKAPSPIPCSGVSDLAECRKQAQHLHSSHSAS